MISVFFSLLIRLLITVLPMHYHMLAKLTKAVLDVPN
jgi:hypothetical protein